MPLASHCQKKEFGHIMDTWDVSHRKKEKAWPMGKLGGGKDTVAISIGAELDQMERKKTFECIRHLNVFSLKNKLDCHDLYVLL